MSETEAAPDWVIVEGDRAEAPADEARNPKLAELRITEEKVNEARAKYAAALTALGQQITGQTVHCLFDTPSPGVEANQSRRTGHLSLLEAAPGCPAEPIVLHFTALGAGTGTFTLGPNVSFTLTAALEILPLRRGDRLVNLEEALNAAEDARQTFTATLADLETFYQGLIGQFVHLLNWESPGDDKAIVYPNLWVNIVDIALGTAGKHPSSKIELLTVTVVSPSWEPNSWNATGIEMPIYPRADSKFIPVVGIRLVEKPPSE